MKEMKMNGEIVVTKNASGQIVAVTRQDEEGRILSILAESETAAVAVPDERAAFESAALAEIKAGWVSGTLKRSEEGYEWAQVNAAWRLWKQARAALAATPPAAAPVVLPEPDINTANHVGIRVVDYTEQQVRALLATGGQAQAQADKQRMDAFMHFMQANCYNPELNADETRNILFNLEQIRAWRSGMHDDYVERLYGRKIHSMGGQEQGEGASTGCAADGAALATGRPAVVAPQAQASGVVNE